MYKKASLLSAFISVHKFDSICFSETYFNSETSPNTTIRKYLVTICAPACCKMRPNVIISNVRPHLVTRGRTLYPAAAPCKERPHPIACGRTLESAATCCNMRPRVIRCGHVLNSQDMTACYKVRPHFLHVTCGHILQNAAAC